MKMPTNTPGRLGKRALWCLLGIMALSVFIFVDLPLLNPTSKYGAFLASKWRILLPHILCGITALLVGPLQFSSRLRQRNLSLHRVLGKIYVGAVLLGALLGYALVYGLSSPFEAAVDVLASLWIITTLAAFITARNHHIAQHRQWMIRSYSVTFFFVADRIPFEFPSFQPSEATNVCLILTLCVVAILLPDIAFTWSELTSKRANSRT